MEINMGKKIIAFLCAAFMCLAAGCAGSGPSSRVSNQTTGVRDVLESGMSSQDLENSSSAVSDQGESALTEDPALTQSAPDTGDDMSGPVDIDLTTQNADMVYAEVFAMMYYPEEYVGKKIKMDGQFAFYHDDETDKYYYACIIQDALACCSQGIEFIPEDESMTIEDFPSTGTMICVTGVFETYSEGDSTFCALKDAKIVLE